MYWVLLIILFLSVKANAQQYKVQPAFTLNELPAIIEGMTYDPVDSNFYFGESVNFKILRYTKSGRSAGNIDAAKDGLTSILGMSVASATHHLWVCGAIKVQGKKIMCVFQYNLNDGRLINRFLDTSGRARLFNDVTIAGDGSVYTTDTYTRSLYKMDTVNKIAILYLQSDSLSDSNGITSRGNILYISTSRGFARVNTSNKTITLSNLANFMIAGNDGLYYHDNSLIGIQNVFFPVTIGRYYLDSNGKRITSAVILAADHPSFVIPTTGVVVNDDFYFMANNNIGTYDPDNDKQLNISKIKKISLVKIPLTKSL
jgi:hypothetical protein